MDIKERSDKIIDVLRNSGELDEDTAVSEISSRMAKKYLKGLAYAETGKVLIELHTVLKDYYAVKGMKPRKSARTATDKIKGLFQWNNSYISRFKKAANISEFLRDKVEGNELTLAAAEILITKLKKYPEISEEFVINQIQNETKFKCPEYKINGRLIKKWFDLYDFEGSQEEKIIKSLGSLKAKLSRIRFNNLTETNKKALVKAYYELLEDVKK